MQKPKENRTALGIAVIALIVALAAITLPYVLSAKGTTQSSQTSQTREFYVVTPEESFNETINGIPHYVFEPTQIVVNQGDTVLIHFYNTGDDTNHTFTLPAYNINVNLPPGHHQDIQFTADKAGLFQFSCMYHPTTMRGELVVSAA